MRYRVGCDIGGTNVKMGLVDPSGRVVRVLVLPSPSKSHPRAMVASLKRGYEAITQGSGDRDKVAGLGIGIAGVIDFGKGLVHTSPNLPRWKEVPLQRWAEEILGVRIRVDNDANVVVLGEFMAGAARGARQVVGLTLGTGVGGGVVIDGRLYRGSRGGAGEIGHCTVQADGPRCSCGNRGCLERYVGAKYLVDRYLKIKGKENCITPAVIAERAKKGDGAAGRVLIEAGEWIGVACANLVNLLQPEVIVIGGGVAGAGKILFEAIRKTVRERSFKASRCGVRIVPGKLKEKAGIIGAASLLVLKRETEDVRRKT